MQINTSAASARPYSAPAPRQATDNKAGGETERPDTLLEQQQKKLEEMQQSLHQLQQIREKNSPDQAALQRASMLKQRLTILKDILGKLPPGNYKAMLQELKQIARELAALARQLDNPALAAGNMSSIQNAPAEETAAATASEAAGGLAHSMADTSVPTDDSAHTEEATPAAHGAGSEAPADDPEDTPASPLEYSQGNTHNPQLRGLLAEAGQALQQVLELIKIKHRDFSEDSRQSIRSIEQELHQLHNSTGAAPILATAGFSVAAGISIQA